MIEALENTPLEELTNSQIEMLKYYGSDTLLGEIAAKRVKQIVRSSKFDPASASTDIGEMQTNLGNAVNRATEIINGLSHLEFLQESDESEDGAITINLRFQSSASISNIVEWQRWADEWHLIIRGIGLCVNEPPENVRVLGASQGSIILTLGATAAVTSLLLLITNHLTKMTLNGLQIANTIEDLRHKKFLNRAIEDGLTEKRKEIEESGVEMIVNEAKASLPSPIDGGQEAALKKSIETYKVFTEKGGEVDFISPPEDGQISGDGDGEDVSGEAGIIQSVRENVGSLREAREEIRLLTQHDASDENDEDEDFEVE